MINEIIDDNEERASLFFEHGMDVNIILKGSDMQNRSPIHFAAFHGSMNVLLALISRGSEIDTFDISKRTPLSLAIEQNKFTCVRSLIELGADIELTDSYGRTPLMFACQLGSKEMVELLL